MKVAVIGAGSWGTAIAWVLGNKGYDVSLWAHTQATADGINQTHKNPRYLVDIELSGVHATASFHEACEGAQGIVFVTPSTNVRETANAVAPLIADDIPVVMCSKGVETGTGLLLTDILAEVLGNRDRIAALSGPNHAEEVSLGIPSGTVVASSDGDCARFFQDLFSTHALRVYTSDDVCGVELCAASKNIIAIANGMASGLGYGDNTSAMLMTRGLAEMSRLTAAMGGNPLTCMGLAGMGDLIATCTSRHSRNRTLGELIASGGTLQQFKEQTHMVAEGATAAISVTDLASKHGVELPISQGIRQILWEGTDPSQMVEKLLTRDLKSELYGMEGER